MENKKVKFFDCIIIGKMYHFGDSNNLYCVVKYCDLSSLKVIKGEYLPVYYISSYYNYGIGEVALIVEDCDKVKLYKKKGGKKVDVK